MPAKNMKELEKMLMRELQKAMNVTSKEILANMYDKTGGFYTKGNPKQYERTGALGDTPNVTALSVGSNSVSFDAYLDTNHQYTTGDKPNMEQVLNLANYGNPWTTKSGAPARATLGEKGFWEKSKNNMGDILDKNIGKFFK